MSQENAEKLMEVLSKLLDLDTSIHRWEVTNPHHSLRIRAVEILPSSWIVVTENWSDHLKDWQLRGSITAYSEF